MTRTVEEALELSIRVDSVHTNAKAAAVISNQ